MKKSAVIYCRVSTKDQVDRYSLETQQKACVDWCNKKGLTVEQIMVEEGESAKTSDRPVFQELLTYCQDNHHRIQAFVVFAISRFARNVRDQLNIEHQLGQCGIRLYSVTEPTEETPMGRAMKKVSAVMAELENEQKAEYTEAGMKTALSNGNWTFKAPIGYKNIRLTDGKASIIPDTKMAPMVLRAFELFQTGEYSQKRLLLQLRNEGFTSLRKKPLTAQTLNNILRNPFYTGKLFVPSWDRTEKGNHEPLITQPVFDFVQRIMAERVPGRGPWLKDHADFPLRRFVRCPTCGKGITGAWSKGRRNYYAYYRCLGNHVKIPKQTMEAQFLNLLRRVRIEQPWIDLFQVVLKDVAGEMSHRSEKTIRDQGVRLQVLTQKREDLLDLYLDQKAISRDQLKERLEKINEEIEFLTSEARDSMIRQEVDTNRLTEDAEEVIIHPDRFWSRANLEGRLQLQQLLFPEGVVFTAKGFKAERKSEFLEVIEDLKIASSPVCSIPSKLVALRVARLNTPEKLQRLIRSLQDLGTFRSQFKKIYTA